MYVSIDEVATTEKFSISRDYKIVSRLQIKKQKKGPVQLSRLKTDKSHRKEGLARELIEKVVNTYRNRGITLKVSSHKDGPTDATLMRIFRKFGFVRKGKTNTMYLNPPRERKKGDRTIVVCPNCDDYMIITPMSYTYYYKHGYGDARCSDSKYDDKAVECKICKLSFAGNHMLKFKGFSTNYWDKEYPLSQWIDEVNAGEGKDRIKYD